MIAKSLWLLQRALPVILLTTVPQFTLCNKVNYEAELSGVPDTPIRMYESRFRRAPFNSWAGKRSGEILDTTGPGLRSLMEGLQQYYLQQQQEQENEGPRHGFKRAPFNSWAGKRAPFNSWAGKRAPFNSWAGKRAPFNSWAGKRSSEEEIKDMDLLANHGDDRFGDASHSHRVKRSSGEYFDERSNTANEENRNHHVRVARDASQSRHLRRRVRSNTAFSAWGGK